MKLWQSVAVTALTVTLSATTASAFSLTGLWLGKSSCKTFTDDDVTSKAEISVLITQSGNDINMIVVGGDLAGSYNGVSLTGGVDPDQGQAGILPCGASTTTATSGVFDVKFASPNAAKLKGRVNVVLHGNSTTVCKVNLALDSTSNPNVPACP